MKQRGFMIQDKLEFNNEYIKKIFEPFMGQEKSYLKLKDINKINL